MANTSKKQTKKKTNKEGFFKGIKKEMSLVKWPSGKDVLKNTIATVVLCIIVAIFFLLLNAGLAAVRGMF